MKLMTYKYVINTVISCFRCARTNTHYCTLKGSPNIFSSVLCFRITIQFFMQFSRPMPAFIMITEVLLSFLKLENCLTNYQNKRLHGKERINLILIYYQPKILMGSYKCLSLPMHIRGPSPNGRYTQFGLLLLFSSVKRSGSNFSGSGKYFGSWWIPNTGIQTPVPTGIFIVLIPVGPVISQSMQQFLSRKGSIGYFLSVSVNIGTDSRDVK